tara:strand:+ start:343 stop:576 length:234 start_codon:yes stop_codon:yes gene_type:complete
MPKSASSQVELTCLQSLADLEQLEGPCMEALSDGDPEGVATVIRLGLSDLAMTAKCLTDAMVLDRLDAELASVLDPA